MLITLEGIDSSGKSTISKYIVELLEKQNKIVIQLKEPDEPYRNILLNDPNVSPREEIFGFLASRARIYHQTIIPSLEKGKFVICDRSIDSTMAYQALARQTIGPNLCNIMNLFAVNGRKPDLTIVMDIDPQLAYKRKPYTQDNLEKRGFDYMNKVRYAFKNIALKESNRVKIIDASLPLEKVKSRIKGLIISKLKEEINEAV